MNKKKYNTKKNKYKKIQNNSRRIKLVIKEKRKNSAKKNKKNKKNKSKHYKVQYGCSKYQKGGSIEFQPLTDITRSIGGTINSFQNTIMGTNDGY
jgi:hypothetical protein